MSARARSTEAGSAYLLALLALVVLSLVGLSLALIGQAEEQLGSDELRLERAFYGAESGVQLGIARLLTTGSSVDAVTLPAVAPMTFTIPEERWPPGDGDPVPRRATAGFAERVEVSPFVPLRDSWCDLCPAGEGDMQLRAVDHAVVATAERVRWSGEGEAPPASGLPANGAARKQVFVVVGLQPWFAPRWEAIADEAAVRKVVQETLGDAAN